MVEQVNLNEVGSLTQSGKHYGGRGEDSIGSAKSHQANMEGMQPGFRGMGGTTAQTVGALSSGTTAQLAKHIVDNAVRAVTAEKSGVTGDEQSHQDQQTSQAAGEQANQGMVPTINFA